MRYLSKMFELMKGTAKQCSKLKIYSVHPPGTYLSKTMHPAVCQDVHFLFILYNHIENLEKACTCRLHKFKNLCTQLTKCVHGVQGAALISNTG